MILKRINLTIRKNQKRSPKVHLRVLLLILRLNIKQNYANIMKEMGTVNMEIDVHMLMEKKT